MKELKQADKVKIKIQDFVRSNTPKGQKHPVGIGWTLWDKLSLTKEEAEIFLSDKSFVPFISKIVGGGNYAYRAIVLKLACSHPSVSKIILSSSEKSPIFMLKPQIISGGLYEGELKASDFLLQDPDSKVQFVRICSAKDAELFLKDPFDKVRLEAYHRIGDSGLCRTNGKR